jgi:phage gp29-like protein
MSLLKAILEKPKNRAPIIGQELTPSKLKLAYAAAQAGNPAALYGLYEFLLAADDEIPSALQNLSSAVLEIGATVVELDESAEASVQRAVLESIFAELDMSGLLESFVEAHYYGFRAVQMVWDVTQVDGVTVQAPVTYELLPLSWIEAKKEFKESEYRTLHVGTQPWHSYPKGLIPIYVAGKLPSYQDLDFTRFGKGYACARLAIFKYYNWADWAAFNEKYGIATLIGKLNQGWNDRDEKLLTQALQGITSDSTGYITDKADITPLDVQKSGTSEAYERFIDNINRAISKIIKSESLTDNMNRNGSNAAMQTTNGIKVNVARKIAGKLETLIARQIVRPIADLNFNGRVLVKVKIPVREVQNLVEETKIDSALLGAGLELSKAELRNRYGRSVPVDTQDTLQKTQTLNLFGP